MQSVQSFDVFDTVVTRRVGEPRAVFEVTGRRLRADGVVDLTPQAFSAVRDGAHADLLRRRREHVRLDEVAAEVADRLTLPPAAVDLLVEAELDAERSLCRAVPGAQRRLAAARAATGRGVVFVSDTPLPEPFLQEVLDGLGLWREGDRVFASGDRAASKEHGALYALVTAELGVAPGEVLHEGDNLRHDVAQARLAGWQATHRGAAGLTLHERRAEARSAGTDGYASWLAGAGRLGRLRAAEDGVDPVLAGIATGVGLPLLAGYALWVLQQVRLQELDTLWFAARDGQVVREVFLPLARQAGCDVRVEYVYGSRISWHVASTATGAQRDHEEWLYETDDRGTVREVLGRLGLTLAEVRALSDAPVLAPGRTDHHLSAPERAELRVLLGRGPLADELRRRAARQRDLMLRYLDEHGLGSAGRYAVVDVGWRGRTARSLEDVLRFGDRPLPAAHLFLGLLEDAPERTGEDLFPRCSAWLFDLARGRGVDLGRTDVAKMVETFTQGTEGYTLGYSEVEGADGTVQPRLARPRNDSLLTWGLGSVRTALDHATAVLAEGPPPPEHVDLRPVAWDCLHGFWDHPSAQEAEIWSNQPWGEDWTGDETAPVGPAVQWRWVAGELRRGRLSLRPNLTWYEGVAMTSGQPWRGVMLAIKRTRRLLPRLRRIPARARAEAALRRSA